MKGLPNPYAVRDGHVCIFIDYKGTMHECLVDIEDYPKVQPYRWKLQKAYNTYYAACNKLSKMGLPTTMHRLLMCSTESRGVVDHRNHQGLDNRRKQNLRLVPHQVNLLNRRGPNVNNTTGYRGVSYDRTHGYYVAQVMIAGKHLALGTFHDPELAAIVVQAKLQEIQEPE